MAHHPVLVAAPLNHLHHNILCLGSHAQVDFLCPKPQHCPGPVMSAVGVGYHLALVHHHDIEIFMVIQHLHGTGLADSSGHLQCLLSSDHGTGQALCVEFVIDLQGQQP